MWVCGKLHIHVGERRGGECLVLKIIRKGILRGKKKKSYLFRVISEKPKFPGVFAPGKLTAIEIHTPWTAKWEWCSTSFWVKSLTCTSTTTKGNKDTSGQLATQLLGLGVFLGQCYFFYNTEHKKGICEIHGLIRYFLLRKYSCVEGWLFCTKTVSTSPTRNFGTEI